MSDVPHGPGWWQATDGRFYAPEQHPNYQPPATTQQVPPRQPAPGAWVAGGVATMAPPEPKKSSNAKGCLIAAAIVLGVLLLLGIAAAMGIGDEESATEATSNEVATTTAAPAAPAAPSTTVAPADPAAPSTTDAPATTAAPKPSAAKGTRENPLPSGQAHDIGDGWTVKVAGYNPNANELVKAANAFNPDPAPGKQYVVVSVEATNTGTETRTSFDLTFDLLGSDNVTISLSSSMCVAPSPAWGFTTGEAYPNGTLIGYLCAEVPSGIVPSLLLIAEPTLALSGNKTFMALS